MIRNGRHGLVAVVVLLASSLVGCSNLQVGSAESSSLAPLVDDAPEGFSEYYNQQVSFSDCTAEQVTSELMSEPDDLQNYQCATVKAPLDWGDPASESIELAIAKYAPKGVGESALFYNLGGPGGDAVESLSLVVSEMLPDQLAKSYQIVAVDPRGVGASTPVVCWTDEERDQNFSGADSPSDDASAEEIVAFLEKESGDTYASCKEKSGDIVDHVDTNSVARDFDMVRALLGQEQLDYLGYSYGTFLGATYANTFPNKVGRMVLDGVLDPAMNANEVSAAQAKGMEESLYHWIETCQEGDSCPLSGDLQDGIQQTVDFFAAVDENPVPAGDRELTGSLARTGVIGSLYSVDSYQYLTMGMTMALQGDGSVLLYLADYYNGRKSDGTYSNVQDAFVAVNSLDYLPVGSVSDWEAQAKQLDADYPVFGSDLSYASAGLSSWGVTGNERKAISATGAPEILLIGNTHDPATPYAMAENLSKELDNSVLVTVESWDHTAYSKTGSTCVQEIVNKFFLKGDLPAEAVTCTAE